MTLTFSQHFLEGQKIISGLLFFVVVFGGVSDEMLEKISMPVGCGCGDGVGAEDRHEVDGRRGVGAGRCER